MKRTKSLIKTAIIALVFMLSIAVSFAITGAWYLATRNAKGTITLNDGIIIDYSGFDQGAGVWENNAEFSLFGNGSAMLPGASVNLNDAAIKANYSSADFFARVKLEYKFFTDLAGEYEVTSQISDYSAFISTPTFAQGWVDGRNGDGWFYYATGSTFNTLPSSDYVNIFTPNQSITLNGDAAGFDHQGGGYQYDEFTLIKRIEVVLTLSTYQADLTAAANAGWEIYVPQVVENSSSQVVEIYSNQITLGDVGGAYKLGTGEAGSLAYDTTTLGTTLKIVVAGDSQINANAFNGSDLEEVYIGDQDYINGVSGYSARIYSSPATFNIGANAFAGCTNLKLYLSSGVNYTIYDSALTDVNKIYYNGSDVTDTVKSTSAGNNYNTITVVATPTPTEIMSSAISSGSAPVSSGGGGSFYTYTDASGNDWRFVLGEIEYYGDMAQYYRGSGANYANVIKCLLTSDATGQTITVPNTVTVSELDGAIVVKYLFVNNADGCSIGLKTDQYNGYDASVSKIILNNNLVSAGVRQFTSVNEIQANSAYFTSMYNNKMLINLQDGTIDWVSRNLSGAITIPNTVTTIGTEFNYCAGITSVTIPSSISVINDWGEGLFMECTSLESFSSSNSKYTTSADGRCLVENNEGIYTLLAFAGAGFSGVYNGIPNTVNIINRWGFAGHTGITSVTIPSSVTKIGSNAFKNCTNLNTITIPNLVNMPGWNYGLFEGCTNLSTVTLGSGVELIYDSMFEGCTNLTSITIPNSVTIVHSEAFYNCSGLQIVTFEGGGTRESLYLTNGAFSGCTSLEHVYYTGTWENIIVTDNGAFEGLQNLQDYNLPS